MQLFTGWKESLAILWPRNLKLLLLATLNAIKQSIIPVLFIIFVAMVLNFTPARFLVYYFVTILFCLVLRPSVQRKTWSYVLSYWKHILYIVPLCILYKSLIPIIAILICTLLLCFNVVPDWAAWLIVLAVTLWIMMFSIFMIFFMFLFFDSSGGLREIGASLGRALRMLLYTLPFTVIIACVGPVWMKAESYVSSQIMTRADSLSYGYFLSIDLAVMLLQTVLLLIFVTLLSILYTKQVHEHFNRYFKQPGE